ncbi:MAG: peptidoglycan DD-metalloendopeptidase family protein [candidate division SR1 bacterium]|nr:peptidoglycan DD-metalloendopeptidase family protein [candidate division SR1 bacterium]
MKKRIGVICILLLMGSVNLCRAQELDTSAAEATNFDVQIATNNMQDLKNNLDGVIQQLYTLDEKERGTGNVISDKYRATRKEIVNVIQTINQTTDTISEQLQKIATYKKLMIVTYKDIQASRSGMVDTKQYIEDFSNFIYKLDNKLYNEDTNTIDEIKLLVNSDNIPRTLANDTLVQSMILQLNDLMSNFKENEQVQLETIKKLNELKSRTKDAIEEYQNEIEKLQQKKNYLLQFMKLYQNDKTQRQLSINNFFESTKGVYDKTVELIKDIKKGVYKTDFDMEKKLTLLNNLENDNEAYPLAWPIYPIENIQTYFGDMNFQKEYGVPHIGIQVQATQGTPVYAARNGIVYFVADNDEIGINRAMIVHTDGYVTIYQYLNKTVIKPGDIVRRGQLIGYSGGEPGTRGAGFISKGANLTFEIFKDGIAMDPFEILDASIVKNKEVLPDGYQIKYLRDKYVRAIDITDLQLMTGATLAKRESQFLTRYGVGIYKQVAFREDVVKDTNIDKDMVICIAFAESTLGKYLSTNANIGNVGNNDRGDRVPFYSAYAGARAIPLTLNNAFLGAYHTINQLSRYGNKDGKIYASSPINWQTNVLKCLSQIKGYYIPEDFPFRTGPNPNIDNPTPETITYGETLSQ